MCSLNGAGNSHGLLRDIVSKLQSPDKSITLFGKKPGSRKPFAYVGEISDHICKIVHRDVNWKENVGQRMLRLCPVDSLTVEEVAALAMKHLGICKEIVWDESKTWKGDQPIVYGQLSLEDMKHINIKYSSKEAIELALRDIVDQEKFQ
jgi:hypothetical protein